MDDSFMLLSNWGLKKESNVGWHHGLSVKCKAEVVGIAILKNERSLLIQYALPQQKAQRDLSSNSSFCLKMHNWSHNFFSNIKR